jgi:hypothetical protein
LEKQKNKLNHIISIVSLVVSVTAMIIVGATALQEGNYYTPILEIGNGKTVEISPSVYYVGDKINFNIPVYANSGSSDQPAKLSAIIYQNGKELTSIERIVIPEHPVLFSILINTTTQNIDKDYFKLKFRYEATNDEPFYKGDVPFLYEGELLGTVEVKEPLTLSESQHR